MPSDLDLVAQAMASSDGSTNNRSAAPQAQNETQGLPPDIAAQLASLSPQERRAMQPLIDALTSSASSGPDELSEREIGDLMRQMDAAEGVAADLEKKLDALLSEVGNLAEAQDQEGNLESPGSAPDRKA